MTIFGNLLHCYGTKLSELGFLDARALSQGDVSLWKGKCRLRSVGAAAAAITSPTTGLRACGGSSFLHVLVGTSTPMPGCCVPQCTNHSRNGWRLFHFPRDPKRRLQWTVKIKRDKWQPTNTSSICSVSTEIFRALFICGYLISWCGLGSS